MNAIPENPDKRLTRSELVVALNEAGFPVSERALANYACRGNGPAYEMFSRRALYTWRTALAWAEARLSPPRCQVRAANQSPVEPVSAEGRA
jgi:hypothetical protein